MIYELGYEAIEACAKEFTAWWLVESMAPADTCNKIYALRENYRPAFNRAMRHALQEFLRDPSVVKHKGDPKVELVAPDKLTKEFVSQVAKELAHSEPVSANAIYESLVWSKNRIDELEMRIALIFQAVDNAMEANIKQ